MNQILDISAASRRFDLQLSGHTTWWADRIATILGRLILPTRGENILLVNIASMG
jgi:hypothetical protein